MPTRWTPFLTPHGIFCASCHPTVTSTPSIRPRPTAGRRPTSTSAAWSTERKSTRLNSSHVAITYAGYYLKKKKQLQKLVKKTSLAPTKQHQAKHVHLPSPQRK